ncbi:hypothetical protein STEG23_031433, partial [Scotinomys teguina]
MELENVILSKDLQYWQLSCSGWEEFPVFSHKAVYMMNDCAHPNHMNNPILNLMGFGIEALGRCFCHEDGPFMVFQMDEGQHLSRNGPGLQHQIGTSEVYRFTNGYWVLSLSSIQTPIAAVVTHSNQSLFIT